jgi:short-subunit dehydrogenase
MNADSSKVAFITGAAAGIGAGLSEYFFRKGYSLFLVDLDADALSLKADDLRKSGGLATQKIITHCADLVAEEGGQNFLMDVVNTFLGQFNRLDVLINNAGITHRSLALETSLSVTKKIMNLDFFVPVELTQLLMPILVKTGKAYEPTKIINLGSMAGWLPVLARSSYCAAKSALHQYFETFRTENSHQPVQVLMVYPSFLATDIEKNALNGNGESANHARSTVGVVHTVPWMIKKIDKALQTKKHRLFPDSLINLASIFYRLLPSLFLYFMERKFSSEFNIQNPKNENK